MGRLIRDKRFVIQTGLWLFLLWAAWAVRLWQLNTSGLTYDEAATFYVADRPLLDILSYLRGAVREHPPVFYLLIRLWMNLTGASEYSLRFFAAGASLLGIALLARLAALLTRRLGVTRWQSRFLYAWLPTLTLALSPFEVYYARDARMYSLVIVWALLSSLCFLPLLFGSDETRDAWPSLWRLLALVGINGLALFTHYYLLLFIATQFVTLLLARRWRPLLGWSAAHGGVGLVGLLWLARSPGLTASLGEAWGRFQLAGPTVGQLRRHLANLLFGPITGVPWTLVYAWGLLVALGLLVAWRRPAPRSRTFGLWLTLSALLPVALAYLMPEPPRSRYLIFVLPFLALAVGQLPALAGKNRPGNWLLWLGCSALVVAVLGVYGLPRTVRWIKSRYGQTVATVSAYARPGDGVLFYGPWQGIQFHYYQPDDFPPIKALPPQAPPQLAPVEAEPVLRELVQDYDRLWVLPAAVDDVDPGHFVERWLNAHAHPVWTTHDLSLYLPPSEEAGFSTPLDLTFDGRLQLQHLAGDGRAVPAGESLRLTLTWSVSEVLSRDVVLKFELLDARGRRWRAWESLPGQWLNPPSTWEADKAVLVREGLVVPQGAPPGPMTVRLTVVDEESGAPLPVADASGPRPGSGVDLFTFQVTEPLAPSVLAGVDDFPGPFVFRSPQSPEQLVTLAAYGLGGVRFQEDYPVTLRLHWLAPRDPLPPLGLRLQLWHRSRWAFFEGDATPVATETLSLIPDYPASEWPAGRLVSLPAALTIPPGAVSGLAELTVAVLGPDGRPWTVNGRPHLTLGEVIIEARPILKQLPADLTPVQVDFGDQIGLRGYRIAGEARPGGQLVLDYGWYALRRPERQYAVFNHLLTPDGQKVAQVDGWPQDPKYSGEVTVVLTTQWRPGEYVPDRYTLDIPADAPPGPYLLAVGLYDANDPAHRLRAVHDGSPLPNDQWLLPVVGE